MGASNFMLDAYESQLNTMQDYQSLAQRTSADPTPEVIARLTHPAVVDLLVSITENIKFFAHDLDGLKKHIFYGKPLSTPLGSDGLFMKDEEKRLLVNENGRRVKIIHGIIGIITEAGELAEALINSIVNGEDFDLINIGEEAGDIFWYLAELLTGANRSFGETQRLNIAKLIARYGDKFSEFKALNRDLDKERGVLEGKLDDETIEQTAKAIDATR